MAEEKLKILYLMQMLLEETDPAHPMNATQLCERIKRSTRTSNACRPTG